MASSQPSEDGPTARLPPTPPPAPLPPPGAGPPLPPAPPAFATGDLLCERFRIVRFLAVGGMGEVYEAEDLQFQERVALKTVRPGLAADPRALELRFKREIQLARKV